MTGWQAMALVALFAWATRGRPAKAAVSPSRPGPPPPRPPPRAPRPEPKPSRQPRFVWPVPAGRMPTAERHQYGTRRSETHTHRGTDIFAPEGSSVLAPVAGTIVRVGRKWTPGFSGFGKFAVLHTDPLTEAGGRRIYVLFAHLSNVEVNRGDRVTAGARIGHVGTTKYTRKDPTAHFASSKPHLHIEASLRPYPMPSEAPRLNSDQILRLLKARSEAA